MIYTKKQAEHIACPTTNSPSCRTDKCSAWRWTSTQRYVALKKGNLAEFTAPKPAPAFREIGIPGISIKEPVPVIEHTHQGTGEYYGYCGLAGKPEYEWPAE